jgi:hypothetical protein
VGSNMTQHGALPAALIDAVALAREAEDDPPVDRAFGLHPLPDGPGRAPTRGPA